MSLDKRKIASIVSKYEKSGKVSFDTDKDKSDFKNELYVAFATQNKPQVSGRHRQDYLEQIVPDKNTNTPRVTFMDEKINQSE